MSHLACPRCGRVLPLGSKDERKGRCADVAKCDTRAAKRDTAQVAAALAALLAAVEGLCSAAEADGDVALTFPQALRDRAAFALSKAGYR